MLIGLENEQKKLKDLLETDKSEFVAVYGRRRIGKTFLIRPRSRRTSTRRTSDRSAISATLRLNERSNNGYDKTGKGES